MAVEPHRLRGGRPTVQAYRNDPAPALRGFVPVESLAAREAPVQPPAEPVGVTTATEPSAGMPPAAVATPAGTPPATPAYVIEPDPGWNERTTLFGDPEG